METDEGSRAEAVTFRAHPAERLVRSLARGHIAGACCCCCCCCCLHSVGSLTGAVLGSFYPPAPVAGEKLSPATKLLDDEFGGPARGGPAVPPGIRNYWLSTLAVTAGAGLVGLLIYGPGAFPGVLASLVFFFPLIQLAGSLLCALVLAAHPEMPRSSAAWKRLGWITLGTVVGGVIGTGIMVVLFRQ